MFRLHHLWNPHCKECRDEASENKVCRSCEILERELAIVREENRRLLEKLLEPEPVPIKEESLTQEKFKLPNVVPWSVKRQLLQQEDRNKARAMKEAPKPDMTPSKDVEELEKELGVQ